MWSFVDPRGDADTAVADLGAMGYIAFDDDNNTSATQSIGVGWAQDDAVWVAYGHAMPGQITIENGATGGPPSPAIGAVVANNQVGISPDFSQGPKAYLYSLPYHQLSKMKLMLFFGCNTGLDALSTSPYAGNLVKEATGDQGVDSSLGFTHEIYFVPDAAGYWSDTFFSSLKNGSTVSNSANAALNMVYLHLSGLPYGFNNPYIVGGTTTIKPAGYGS